MKDFESVPHTADIQIRVYGATLEELFTNALVGMFQSIGPKAEGCQVVDERLVCPSLPQEHIIQVNAPDKDALLVDFLSEALYLSDINNEAYLAADIIEFSDCALKARLKGVKVIGFEVVEIKAVTYHNLCIKQVNGIWQTDIVFDI